MFTVSKGPHMLDSLGMQNGSCYSNTQKADFHQEKKKKKKKTYDRLKLGEKALYTFLMTYVLLPTLCPSLLNTY